MKYTTYIFSEETDDSSDSNGVVYLNKEDAIYEANSWDTSYPDRDSNMMLTISTFEISKEKALEAIGYNEEDELEDGEIIEMLVNDCDFYNLSKEIDITSEDISELEARNKSSEELIDQVTDILSSKMGRRISKYSTLYVDEYGNLNNEDGELVNIRIADHTHNPANGRNDLNVLICNHDHTADKYRGARTHLAYSADNSAAEIVEDILNYWK